MRKFRFREFQMYKDSRLTIREIKDVLEKRLPDFEKFGMKSQLWRALDSIILNIAEGSDRSTDKDFANFLNQAHTSLNECVACLDICLDNKYISETEVQEGVQKLESIANQITAFRNKLLSDNKSVTQK